MKAGLFSIQKKNLNPDGYFTYRNQVTMWDCPHLMMPLKKAERERMKRKFGEDSFIYKSMVLGKFHRSDAYTNVFSENEIAMVINSMKGEANPWKGQKYAAMDPTGGGDAGVFMRRIGTRVDIIDDTRKSDELELADYWICKMRDLHMEPHQAWVDAMGLGGTVIKHMRRNGFSPNPFTANVKPTYSNIWKDRYSEILGMLKMMIQLNILALPMCHNLIRDMRSRRYVTMSDNKIKAEEKTKHRQRENFSPDYLDTLIYLFMDFDQTLLEDNLRNLVEQEQSLPDEPGAGSPIMLEAAKNLRGDNECFGGIPDQPFMGDGNMSGYFG